jgi:hypothetical protein
MSMGPVTVRVAACPVDFKTRSVPNNTRHKNIALLKIFIESELLLESIVETNPTADSEL